MSTKKIQSKPSHHISGRPQPRFKKIVIINDNDVDLFINEALLNEISLSREVKREDSPFNVISELKQTDRLSDVPELIFLDLKMESKNGYSFLDEFRLLSDFVRNKCKIVVITSAEHNEDKFRILMNPSVIRLLVKPVDVFQIKEIINS